MKWTLLFFILSSATLCGQTTAPKHGKKLSGHIANIIKDCNLDSSYDVQEADAAQVSVAVIRFGKHASIAGVNLDRYIYPASVYKMYVAMEILNQVNKGLYALNSMHIVTAPNDVDSSKEISYDPRPLLRQGDTVTINYLLDLMITRSDNTAANCLIDVAGRKNINETMQANGWHGSEVTRKFLSRKLEEKGYENVAGTVTTARHAATFLYQIEMNQLVNSWVSKQMKALLARQLDESKLSMGLPAGVMFSHKTGWWNYYTHDVGIVEAEGTSYVLAVFTPIKEAEMNGRLQKLAQKIHALMLKQKR